MLLCTRDLTGVGAAMASGSQELKGKHLLLVRLIRSKKKKDTPKAGKKITRGAALKKKNTSPSRLIKKVLKDPDTLR